MDAKGDFTVMVNKKEVVAAVLPLQEHWLPLSNLDLLIPRQTIEVNVFFCYRSNNNTMNFDSIVDVLKKSMAQALVSFYPFAGEVVANSVGEPELLCNNRSVDFIEAYADIELRNLNLYNPDQSVHHKIVPEIKRGVLSVQVTKLKCGGIVVACTFDHRVADAYSANMFLVSWAEIAQSKPISLIPSFRRSLLNPIRQVCIDPSLNQMYTPISTLPSPKDEPTDHLISRTYYIKAHHLNQLQSLASSNGCKRTKLESFSAFLWKLVAQSAKTEHFGKISKMGIVVDGRTRLFQGGTEDKANPMAFYFGNVLSIPFGGEDLNDLIEKPLHWVANQVHDFLRNSVTTDNFFGLIDWIEAHRPEPVVYKIYTEDQPAFAVSSGLWFPFSKVDFGWGRPDFWSYYFPWGGKAGYVMPMPSAAVEGDCVVYLNLSKGQLDFIETQASNVFKPLTSDYLGF